MEKNENLNGETNLEVLALGIDFANDFTQVSYITNKESDPISMSTIKGEKRYLIPTILYKKREINEWVIGDEANQRFYDDDDDSQIANSIVTCAMKQEEFIVEDKNYSSLEILTTYFSKLLCYSKELIGSDIIHEIVVTIEKPEKEFIDDIHNALKNCGISSDNIRVLSHAEAFIYYTTNQKREVWVNDVALFDFNDEHFSYRRLSLIKTKNPNIINVTENSLSTIINHNMILDSEGRARADEKFYEYILEEFRKHIVSAVYLTGVGFYEEWGDKSLAELCTKRRVFKGYNLFVKGACYAAYKKYCKINAVQYTFQCMGRTSCNIGIMIDHDGKNIVMLLSKAGTNWYEAGAKVECILDNIKQIQMVFSPAISTISRNVILDLSAFPERPNKTTRVSISIAYRCDNVCDIEVKDLGFGEFYQATDMVIRKTVDIDDLLL